MTSETSCAVSGFTGFVRVTYSSYNTTLYRVTKSEYKLAPSDSSSDLNNVKHVLFGGSSSATLASTASGLRDGVYHTIYSFPTSQGGVSLLARKDGSAYVTETVDFDRFGTDPNCSKRAYL